MFLSDKQREQFTELYIRTCRSRDSIPLLLAFRALRSLGAKERIVRVVWDLIDCQRTGRLTFGQFLVACRLSIHSDHICDIPHEIGMGLRKVLDAKPPIPLYPAEEEETLDLQGARALSGDHAVEAIRMLEDNYEPLQLATAHAIALLALRHESHECLLNSCSLDTLISRLNSDIPISGKRDIASFLCSVTSTAPESLNIRVFRLLRIFNKIDDSHCRFLMVACIANCFCDFETAKLVIEAEDASVNLKSALSLNDATQYPDMVAEIIRLVVNMSACLGVEKSEVFVRTIFQSVLRPAKGIRSNILNEYGMKYIFILISESWSVPTLQRFFLHDLKGVEWLAALPLTQGNDSDLAARVLLLLSKAALRNENHIALVEQGGLQLGVRLYKVFPLDEIIQMNVVLIGCSLSQSPELPRLLPELFACGYSEILQHACEHATHLEIVSRALDAWAQLALLNEEWRSGILTAVTLLFSESLEVSLKALELLSQLVAIPKQREVLFQMGFDRPQSGSDKFFNLILSCLPAGNEQEKNRFDWTNLSDETKHKCEVTFLEVLLRIIEDRNHAIRLIIEKSEIVNILNDIYVKVSPIAQDIIADVFSALIICGSKTLFRGMLSDPTSSVPHVIDILATHLESSSLAHSALMMISQNTLCVERVSKHLTKLINIATEKGQSVERLQSATCTIKHICRACANATVAKYLQAADILDVVFASARHQTPSVVLNCLKILHALLIDKRGRWNDEVLRPSRIARVIETLTVSEPACHVQTLKCVALLSCASQSSHIQLVIDSAGFHLPLLIESLIKTGRTEFVILLSTMVNVPRVTRLVRADVGFRSRCFDELIVLITHVLEFVHRPRRTRSERVIAGLSYFHIVNNCYSDGTFDDRMKQLASAILLNGLSPLLLSRIAPSLADHQAYLVNLLLLIPRKCIQMGSFDIAATTLRSRIARFKQACDERIHHAGKDALSDCFETFYMESIIYLYDITRSTILYERVRAMLYIICR